MEGGMVCLKPIYDFIRNFVREHPDTRDQIAAYRINVKSGSGKDYCDECREVLDDVPDKQGFYLWGFYNSSKFWINVYLGKAHKGKTAHLKDRLYKELTAERASIWREVNPDNATLLKIGQEIHPTMWREYESHWKRALHKVGSTHILWVATPDLTEGNVAPIESDLIEAMNPTGNRQRRMPSATLQQEAGKVFNSFREIIHLEKNRETQFDLTYHKRFWESVGKTEPSAP